MEMQDKIQDAARLVDKGRYPEALETYDEALRLESGNPEAHYGRAFVLQKLGRFEAALESYDMTLKQAPDDIDAYLGRGSCLHRLRLYDEALDNYRKALDISDRSDIHHNMALVLEEVNELQEAIKSYDKAIALNPTDIDSLLYQAMALAELDRQEEAIQTYDRVLAIDGRETRALVNKGACLLELGRYMEAEAVLDIGIKLNPRDIDAVFDKAFALEKQEKHEEALKWYDKVLAIRPDAEASYRKAVVHAKIGQTDSALSSLKEALRLDPSNKQEAWDDSDFATLKDNVYFRQLVGKG